MEEERFSPSVPQGEQQKAYEDTDLTFEPLLAAEDLKPIRKVYLFAPNDGGEEHPSSRSSAPSAAADSEDPYESGFVLYNVLSPSECRYYIERAEALGLENCGYDTNYRNTDRVVANSEATSRLIWERIKDFIFDIDVEPKKAKCSVGKAYRLEGHWKAHQLNECWRLCRYKPGGHFAPHFDGTFIRSFHERSMKTFMLYLNGDFEGGTTNFVKEGQELYKDETGIYRAQEHNILQKLKPEPGMALVFNHRILHEGGQVLSNQKYIMRSDILFSRDPSSVDIDPKEQEALRMLEQAEDLETERRAEEAARLYRSAFKLWPPLERI
ncbi:Fe2OG dioxygenase domain-containing protein [Balamuthia mandrillaris]